MQPQSTSSSPPAQILDYLDENSHASPAELKAALGKSSATVYRALCELIAAGFVERKGWGRASQYVLVEVDDDETIDVDGKSSSEPTSPENSPLSQNTPNKLKPHNSQARSTEASGREKTIERPSEDDVSFDEKPHPGELVLIDDQIRVLEYSDQPRSTTEYMNLLHRMACMGGFSKTSPSGMGTI